MKTGRNEPCPCGSGKKYKKCCYLKDRDAVAKDSLAEAEKEEGVNDFSSEDIDFLRQAILNLRKFSLKRLPHVKEYLRIRKLHELVISAMTQYHEDGKFELTVHAGDDSSPDLKAPTLETIDSNFDLGNQTGAHCFYDMMIYNSMPNATCITEEFLNKHRYRKPEKIEFLRCMLDSRLGLFEVIKLDANNGYAYLREVFTGIEHKIVDLSLSAQKNTDEVYLYMRIITYQGISFGTGLCLVFDKTDDFIQRHIERYKENYSEAAEFYRFLQLYNHFSAHSAKQGL